MIGILAPSATSASTRCLAIASSGLLSVESFAVSFSRSPYQSGNSRLTTLQSIVRWKLASIASGLLATRPSGAALPFAGTALAVSAGAPRPGRDAAQLAHRDPAGHHDDRGGRRDCGMRNRSKALSRSARPSRNARSTRRPPGASRRRQPRGRPGRRPARCRGWAGKRSRRRLQREHRARLPPVGHARPPHEVRGPQVAARDEHAQLGIVEGPYCFPSRAMYHWISVSVPVMAVSRADAQTALCSRISRVLTGDGRHFRSPRRGSSIAIRDRGKRARDTGEPSTGWLTSSKHQKVAFSKALRVRQAAGTCAVGVM